MKDYYIINWKSPDFEGDILDGTGQDVSQMENLAETDGCNFEIMSITDVFSQPDVSL